jgi:hypothetical protein
MIQELKIEVVSVYCYFYDILKMIWGVHVSGEANFASKKMSTRSGIPIKKWRQ